MALPSRASAVNAARAQITLLITLIASLTAQGRLTGAAAGAGAAIPGV
jgi:hypothetical protein